MSDADLQRLFKGPLYDTGHGPLQTYCCAANERIEVVRHSTDRAALEDALRAPDLQKIVADAIRRRLKKL